MLFEQDYIKSESLSHQLPRNGWSVGSPLHLFTFSLFPSFHPFTLSPFHLFTFPIFSPFHLSYLFTSSPFHFFTFPLFSPFHPSCLFTFSPFLSFHLFTFSPFSPFHPPFKQQGWNNIGKGHNCTHTYNGDGSKRM